MTALTPDLAARRPGWWIPWLFVAAFGVIVAVNATMIFYALDSRTGLAETEHFRKGTAYNRNLAAARAQAGLGWDVRLGAVPAGGQSATLDLTLADRAGTPLRGAAVEIRLVRPVGASADFATILPEREAGRYAATVTFPLPGLWDVRTIVRHPAGAWEQVDRIEVAR